MFIIYCVSSSVCVSGDAVGALVIANYETGQVISGIARAHSRSVESVSFFSAATLQLHAFASTSLDGTLKVWSLRDVSAQSQSPSRARLIHLHALLASPHVAGDGIVSRRAAVERQ